MIRIKGDGKKVEDYVIGKPHGMLIARVPIYGKLRFYDRERAEKKKGINVGDEWAYRSYIQGGSLASAVWTFDNIRSEDFPKDIEVEMTLGIFRTYMGDIVSAIPGNLYIRNPRNGIDGRATDLFGQGVCHRRPTYPA